MLTNNQISIFRKPKPIRVSDFCLQFSGAGFISIDALPPFLDHKIDFSFSMSFKVDTFPEAGYSYLMNSCLNRDDNKIGIAIGRHGLYVQVDKGHVNIIEFFISFTDVLDWHIISLVNFNAKLSASLDGNLLEPNAHPVLVLPSYLGFRIASDTNESQNFSGLVNNLYLSDLTNPVAQFNLDEGSGTAVFDSISGYQGLISNGTWSTL